MGNHLGVPGYSVQQVAQMRKSGSDSVLLDVRETPELAMANLGSTAIHVPLSNLAAQGLLALPDSVRDHPDAEIIVFCHHGVRSAQVIAWLRNNGFDNAFNMDGGIDAYARSVDPSIGLY